MQPIAMPLVTVGGLSFNLQALIAIDWHGYCRPVHQEGEAEVERSVDIFLHGPHVLTLENEEADAFKLWFDQSTGQSRIQPPDPHIKLA